jgi:DNA-binding protein Fis
MNSRVSLFYKKKHEYAFHDIQNREAKKFNELFKDFIEEHNQTDSRISKRDFLTNFLEYFCVKNEISFRELMDQLERAFLVRILSEMNGNQKLASEILGIKHTTLHEKVKKHRIQFKKDTL